ncbi:hypothetical protein ACJ73_04461 [Blastomyces percursus]|uniref:Uncharacterized protein n=1 Tax=Blastomyces percursus TaxID=1658174 RepID=A0A1J9R6P1_9EURO|nr:hypothetical protein ACJ73_04461 [Blastomyces percursus]
MSGIGATASYPLQVQFRSKVPAMEGARTMDESDTNPPRRARTSGTRRSCTHAAIASLTRPPRTFGPVPSPSITPSLHRYMAYAAPDMLQKPDTTSARSRTYRRDFPAGVDRSHRKIATLELKLKLGSFEPRASEKGGWKRSPFQLFLRPTRGTSKRQGEERVQESGKEWRLFLFSDAAIGIDHPFIPTGFHRNEAFLPLAAEQEARQQHERGDTEGTRNRGSGQPAADTGGDLL